VLAYLVLALCGGACVPGDFDKLTRGGEQADADVPPWSDLDASRSDGGMATLDGAGPLLDASRSDDGGDDAAASDAAAQCPTSASQRVSVSKPAQELARLAPSPVFSARMLGPITRWGTSDHVWVFSNARRLESLPAPAVTAANHPFIAFDGATRPWRSNITVPWKLKVPTGDSQLPPTLFPLQSGEDAASALLPSSIVRVGTEMRTRLYAVQYDNFVPTKVWLATLEDAAVAAKRSSQPLFSKPPLFAIAARADGDFVTVYACLAATDKLPSRCVVGRVPSGMIGQASAYQVRVLDASNQWVWSDDLQTGTPVLENVNGTDLTVSYNNYLRRFLAVYGEPLSNDVVLRSSAQPWGPWSEPVRVALPSPAALFNLSIREQAPLAQDCERRLVISYFAPTSAVGVLPSAGDTVLAAIELD
jgi:Domain of unknown function (DUF4185)